MRDDIYHKEREIQDLKNQINLVNLRISKENEAKDYVEINIRKNTDQQDQDIQNLRTNFKSAEKDNHIMKSQLQEMVKYIDELNNIKTTIAGKLDQRDKEHEEALKQFTIENDEQNKLIKELHQKLKDLQDKLNRQNQKGHPISSK